MSNTQECCVCHQELLLEKFNRDKYSINGYSRKCKQCKKLTKKHKEENPYKEGYKYCISCCTTMENNFFPSSYKTKDGLSNQCQKCTKYKKSLRDKDKKIIENIICKDCKIEKSITEFYKSGTNRTGYSGRCKICERNKDKYRTEFIFVEEKICTKCKEIKPRTEFMRSKANEYGLTWQCKGCINLRLTEQRKTLTITEKRRRANRGCRYNKWAYSSIRSHRNNGINILFKKDDLIKLAKETTTCIFCGLLLDWSKRDGTKRGPKDLTPTLENLHLKNEVTMEDVMIICHKCNTTKSNRTLDEYIKYLDTLITNLRKISGPNAC